MQSETVWLVGDEKSPKNNQWMAMTPSRETAMEYMADNNLTTLKEVKVPQQRGRRR